MRLSAEATTQVREMVNTSYDRLRSENSNMWYAIRDQATTLAVQAKEIADLKLRLSKVEPHDHKFKCTTCGMTHEHAGNVGAPSH